ncbi:MAG TPA: GntR family transcriptional regulator [Candidatus Dormibacteraeota bacterium]|nr:GntR family transcriptional regulator [Candidatus Dormibacteraeota bacterium]
MANLRARSHVAEPAIAPRLPSDQPIPLLRNVLRSQVRDLLIERIVEGYYKPGARLVETQIARELGVSQAPVREALRDLESVGVVESHAFKGARVRNPTRAELLEAYPVRAVLESLAAGEAAARITDAQLDQLEDLIDQMEKAAALGQAHRQANFNAQFHGLIVEAAQNSTLARLWQFLEPWARTYLTAARSGVDLHELAVRHRKIVAPLRARDAHGAAAAMHDHLMEAARWLQDGTEK